MFTRHGLLLLLGLTCSCGSGTPSPASGERSPNEGAGEREESAAGDPAPPELAELLEAHNRLRAEHCAPPLAWSSELAETAQGWADELGARGCKFEHSKTRYGENLMTGTAGAFTPDEVVGAWYAEKKDYRFGSGGFSMKTGHFTQVVWVGTSRVGCGTTTCKGKQIWVCNYDPPGNMKDQYKENVLPSSCKK